MLSPRLPNLNYLTINQPPYISRGSCALLGLKEQCVVKISKSRCHIVPMCPNDDNYSL